MKKLFILIITILLISPASVLANTTTSTTTSITTERDTYITVQDLENYKTFLQNDNRIVTMKIGNILFYKNDDPDNVNFILAEKNNFSSDAYNSLLSIIEVMFDKETVDYFKIYYKEIKTNQDFKGFKIEVNPARQIWEDNILKVDNYVFIRVNVDRDDVKKGLEDLEVVEDDLKTIIMDIFTDQSILTSKEFFGFKLGDILLFFLAICLLLYILFAVFLNNFHKVHCGQSALSAFLPILNVYILGKLAINKIYGWLLLLTLLFLGSELIITEFGLLDINPIIPISMRKYVYIGYGIILLITYIFSVFKYDRIKSEAGGITLRKLKRQKKKKTKEKDTQVTTLPGETNVVNPNNLPGTIGVQDTPITLEANNENIDANVQNSEITNNQTFNNDENNNQSAE